MIKQFIYNLSRNDPGAHVLSMVIKVGAIMFLYFFLAWSFGLVYEVIIWVFYFLAFSAMVCAVGDIYSRRKIFILFLIGFCCALTVSYWLHPHKFVIFMILIIASYFAFWIRKYNGLYKTFPGYIVIVFAISTIQLPVLPQDLLQLYLSLASVSIAFFILILILRPWDTPKQLLRVLQMHALLLQNEIKINLKESIKPDARELYVDKARKNLNRRLDTLHEKGAAWILSPKRKLAWHKCYDRYHVLIQNIFRLIFFYHMLTKKRSTIAESIMKKTELKDVVHMATNLPVWVFLIPKEDDFNQQLVQFKTHAESFKYGVLTAPTLKGCQVVLLEIILLLENLNNTTCELREFMREIQ